MTRFAKTLLLISLSSLVLNINQAKAETLQKHQKPKPLLVANYNRLLSEVAFIESEITRTTHTDIKLSAKFFIYWDLIEKVKMIKSLDKSKILDTLMFPSNIMNIAAKHGIMPETYYASSGLKTLNILSVTKEIENNSEPYSFEQLKKIIDDVLGIPPHEIKINDTTYNALMYMNEKLKFNPMDYYHFVSDTSFGYYQKLITSSIEYPQVGKNCYNIPPDTLSVLMKDAIDKGYKMQLHLKYKDSDFINNNLQRWLNRKYKIQKNDNTISFVVSAYEIKKSKLWFYVNYFGFSDQSKLFNWNGWIDCDELLRNAPSLLMYKYAASRVLDKIIK